MCGNGHEMRSYNNSYPFMRVSHFGNNHIHYFLVVPWIPWPLSFAPVIHV